MSEKYFEENLARSSAIWHDLMLQITMKYDSMLDIYDPSLS